MGIRETVPSTEPGLCIATALIGCSTPLTILISVSGDLPWTLWYLLVLGPGSCLSFTATAREDHWTGV